MKELFDSILDTAMSSYEESALSPRIVHKKRREVKERQEIVDLFVLRNEGLFKNSGIPEEVAKEFLIANSDIIQEFAKLSSQIELENSSGNWDYSLSNLRGMIQETKKPALRAEYLNVYHDVEMALFSCLPAGVSVQDVETTIQLVSSRIRYCLAYSQICSSIDTIAQTGEFLKKAILEQPTEAEKQEILEKQQKEQEEAAKAAAQKGGKPKAAPVPVPEAENEEGDETNPTAEELENIKEMRKKQKRDNYNQEMMTQSTRAVSSAIDRILSLWDLSEKRIEKGGQ